MNWRKSWREGFAPVLSTAALNALAEAIRNNDPRLIQGSTTSPPALNCVFDWPNEGGCAIGYAVWRGGRLETVGDVSDAFARACFEADQWIGEPAACRWFLNWFDDTPRDEVRRLLLSEIERELEIRDEATPDEEPPPDDENKPAELPWWTPENIRRQMEAQR